MSIEIELWRPRARHQAWHELSTKERLSKERELRVGQLMLVQGADRDCLTIAAELFRSGQYDLSIVWWIETSPAASWSVVTLGGRWYMEQPLCPPGCSVCYP